MRTIDFLGGKYFISDDGRVFSAMRGSLKELKLQRNKKGYKVVVLRAGARGPHTFAVSRLVYQTYVGEIPAGYQVDHIDGNKTNNHVSNLRAITNDENQRHKHELIRQKAPNSRCKLCKAPFYAWNVKRFCSPHCQRRAWRLEHKRLTGHWL